MTDLIFAINSPELQQSLWWLRIPLMILSAVFVAIIVYVLVRSKYLYHRYLVDLADFINFKPFRVRRMIQRWGTIEGRVNTTSQAEYKLAISEADGILVDVLQRINLPADTPTEKLNMLPANMIANVEQLKDAHELRNTIVRNPSYQLSRQEAEEALKVYEEAFRSLDLM